MVMYKLHADRIDMNVNQIIGILIWAEYYCLLSFIEAEIDEIEKQIIKNDSRNRSTVYLTNRKYKLNYAKSELIKTAYELTETYKQQLIQLAENIAQDFNKKIDMIETELQT